MYVCSECCVELSQFCNNVQLCLCAAIKHVLIEYVQVTEQIDKRLCLSPFGFCNPCGTIGPSTLTAI